MRKTENNFTNGPLLFFLTFFLFFSNWENDDTETLIDTLDEKYQGVFEQVWITGSAHGTNFGPNEQMIDCNGSGYIITEMRDSLKKFDKVLLFSKHLCFSQSFCVIIFSILRYVSSQAEEVWQVRISESRRSISSERVRSEVRHFSHKAGGPC